MVMMRILAINLGIFQICDTMMALSTAWRSKQLHMRALGVLPSHLSQLIFRFDNMRSKFKRNSNNIQILSLKQGLYIMISSENI